MHFVVLNVLEEYIEHHILTTTTSGSAFVARSYSAGWTYPDVRIEHKIDGMTRNQGSVVE